MTLIVAVPASDGAVFGSDRQVTSGEVRDQADKIFELGRHTLWGGAGELAVIQRVSEGLARLKDCDDPLCNLRDDLSRVVKDAVRDTLQLDFRTPYFAQDPDALLRLHPADFLFVEHRDAPRVLHVQTNGTSEWIDGRFAAIGNGELFAHALLKKYARLSLPCDTAKLLVYKVIEEAIEVGSYGLGPPIDIWAIRASDGARRVREAELAALADSARILRSREIEMLAGGAGNGS